MTPWFVIHGRRVWTTFDPHTRDELAAFDTLEWANRCDGRGVRNDTVAAGKEDLTSFLKELLFHSTLSRASLCAESNCACNFRPNHLLRSLGQSLHLSFRGWLGCSMHVPPCFQRPRCVVADLSM